MYNDARKLVLSGLFISLAVFSYLTISFIVKGIIGWAIDAYGFEISGLLLAFFFAIDIPFAIEGIVQLLRKNSLHLGTVVVSAVFNGFFGCLFLTGMIVYQFLFQGTFLDWLVTLVLLANCVLLIVAAVKANKELAYLIKRI